MKTKLVIVIEGGVLRSVQSNNQDAEVKLIDCDDLEAEGKTQKEMDDIFALIAEEAKATHQIF